MRNIKAYVVNHGHMDIEWVQPLTTFGLWFREAIEMLDQIARDDPAYQCYVYDGVVFPILYTLDRNPQLKETVERLIRDGKLKIGPFYTQFDEFLTCGESMIRNCLWGDRKCRALGAAPMKAGYLLDNFGHPAQLPQIFNQFGIRSLFFMRGMCDIGDNTKEFVFRAPDGSELAAQNFNYSASFDIFANNSPRANLPNYLPYDQDEFFTYEFHVDMSKHLDHEGIARQMIEGVKQSAAFYPSGIVPVFAGTDHCPPQEGLTQTLALANAMQDEIEFLFTDAEALSNALYAKKDGMPTFGGDLIGSKFSCLLPGAFTSRIYLKQKMYNGEKHLFDYALPLTAYAQLLGEEHTQNLLDEATEMLMLNSTHDSIHGSSISSVHRENEYRFDLAAQLCMQSIHDSMAKISRHLRSTGEADEFTVYSPRDYEGYVSAWIYTDGGDIAITDAEGQVYDCVAAPQSDIPQTAKGLPYFTRATKDSVREVLFKAHLRAGEVKKFFYKKISDALTEPTRAERTQIGNEYYTLSVTDGKLVLTDLVSGHTVMDFLTFTEEADTGDTFDFSTPWKDTASYTSDPFPYTDIRVTDGRLFQRLCATCTLRVPLETVGDERSESLVDIPIRLTFMLWQGVQRLDVGVRIANYAKNHRVRAVFTAPMSFDHVTANETFCVEDFSIHRPPRTEFWDEEATRELPFRDWVSVGDEATRTTIAAKGLYVFEPLDDRRIAFTLFRSIGELMRINLKNRAGCCAPGYAIQDAQCLREMDFQFALFTQDTSASPFAIERAVEPYINPPAVHAARAPQPENTLTGAMQPYTFIDNQNFVVSSFGLSYDKQRFLLRFYEKNGQAATAKIDLSSFGRVFLSNMNEACFDVLDKKDGVVELPVGPCKVITLLMERA